MTSQQNDFDNATYNQQFKDNTYSELGRFALNYVFG